MINFRDIIEPDDENSPSSSRDEQQAIDDTTNWPSALHHKDHSGDEWNSIFDDIIAAKGNGDDADTKKSDSFFTDFLHLPKKTPHQTLFQHQHRQLYLSLHRLV